MKTAIDYSVYLVTDRPLCLGRDFLDVVEKAVSGGVTVVQLREKECGAREFVELARAVQQVLAPRGVPLIINDRADVALAVGAQGLHVGQTDLPYADARRIMGPDCVIGLSVDTLDQARDADALDVDYLGVGPVFATQTKPDAGQALGLEGFARVREASRHVLVAIGSITPDNAEDVIRAGAGGLAVVSALCSQEDPAEAARRLAQAAARGRKP